MLRQRGIEYLCYCDTYRTDGTHNGHPIISPEVLRDEYAGVPVLITTIHHRSVAESLSEYGPHEILDSVPLLVEVDFSGWGNSGEKMTEEWAVQTVTSYLTTMLSAKTEKCFQELTVYVTQKCNFCCIDCLEPEGLQERVEWGFRHFAECDHFDLCHRCSGLPQIHHDATVPPAVQATGPLYLT